MQARSVKTLIQMALDEDIAMPVNNRTLTWLKS